MSRPPILAIIVPCYNEEPVIEETAQRLMAVMDNLKSQSKIAPSSFIYFVDDGSKDNTWSNIVKLHNNNKAIKGLKLSKNVGHQNAILAGLVNVKGQVDCAITIDADLQDDVSAIEKMVGNFSQGYEIVYGVRKERKTDSIFKRFTALLFYKFIKLIGADLVYNHADYRLTSRRVIEELSQFREVNLFLRGIFPLMGFKSINVYYDRGERLAGVSKYPLKKMLAFALEGITSFSVTPLRLVTLTGAIVFVFSLALSIWAFIMVFTGNVVPGWASTVIPIYFLGGIQLLSIGLIGEYIGKIYKEVKVRPKFIKDKELL
ncbi:MAG: glycosyltransferase family 2 protein [Nitrospinota bacterium]